MPNVFKPSGAKATGWFKNRFQFSLWKLTFLYAAILAIILFVSSGFIYSAFSSRLESRFRNERPLPDEVAATRPPPPTAKQVREDLVRSILIVNGFLFVVAGLSSYVLAQITLEPLQEMYDGQRKFFGDASHELRTPLSILQIELENAREDAAQNTVEYERLTSHLEEVERMSKLVNDLLTVSRFDEYHVPEQKQFSIVNLIALTESIILRLNSLAERQNVKIVFDLPEHEVAIFGQEDVVVQAITNVLKNAIVYNHSGGSVTVSVAMSKHTASLRIVDTGIGIAATDREKIFDRFYRAEASRSRQTGGSGLGLSIVQSSMHYLGGSVSVASELGVGTTVSLNFPIKKAS